MRAQLIRHPLLAVLPVMAIACLGMAVIAPPAQAAPEDVFINELHYDNESTDTGEAIELAGPAGTDLSGYELVLYSSGSGEVYDTQELSGTLPDQQGGLGTVVVEYPSNGIQNGDADAIALVHDGVVLQFLSYEGTLTAVGGPADGMTSTDIGVDEGSSTPAGSSLQLTGQGTTYADFTWAEPQPETFGQVNTGQTFGEGSPDDGGGNGGGGDDHGQPTCDATDLTRISQVQGAGSESPLAGEQVTVEGAVTAIYPGLGGITVQEEPGDTDSDPATSEGVFVFLGFGADFERLDRGDVVQVTGGVSERFGNTQISGDYAVCDASAVEIEPTALDMPADEDERETLEGMLVTTVEDLTVTGLFSAYAFNELGVSSSGILRTPTAVHDPGSAAAEALAAANARNLLYIDARGEYDNRGGNQPWFGEAGDRAGDVVEAGVVGTLYYSFGDYLLEPVGELPEVVDSDAPTSDREPAPDLAAGNDVASFNVLNYFNTFGDSAELRGARSLAQFQQQTAKIVDAIISLDAAVVGLVELENDYDTRQSDVGEDQPAIATLVERLNAAPSDQTYDWVRVQDLLTDEGFGGLGTDAIAQGIIYQPDRATPIGEPATFDIDALLGGEDTDNNRWPLAQTFAIDGEKVTVVVNHFKSKGSTCSDTVVPEGYGDGQNDPMTGSCDLVREYAAQRLLEWIEDNPTGAETSHTLVIGDLNSYPEEDPIDIFEEAGYLDTVARYGDGPSFTYKFDGTFGRLDYILASPSAQSLVVDAEVWQANAPEPYGYLYYNSPIDDTAYASSDHNPVVVSLGTADTTPPEAEVSLSHDVLWPPNGRYVEVTATVDTEEGASVELVDVTSDEPEVGRSCGHRPDDVRSVDDGDDTVLLRAERCGRGDGRVYTFTYRVSDDAGNSREVTATVAVPHDRGNGTGNGNGRYTLTLLHANDMESELLGIDAPAASGDDSYDTDKDDDGRPDYGGADRFATVVDHLRDQGSEGPDRDTVVVSAGDVFLAGPQLAASQAEGTPFYDAIAMTLTGYDASTIGNHEFDFGPDFLAEFVRAVDGAFPFLSANLDFTGEPALQQLVETGAIVERTIVEKDDGRIGLIGLTTPSLPAVTSPGAVTVDPELVAATQRQVDALQDQGIDKIVLVSHLQDIDNERELAGRLDGVDVIVGGGGQELLADDEHPLLPGDERSINPDTGEPYQYPIVETDADGTPVPIVTTPGKYAYVGKLVVTFNRAGHVIPGSWEAHSRPVPVAGVGPDAVQPDPQVNEQVVQPVAAFVENLQQKVVAETGVELVALRQEVRTRITNFGALITDAVLWSAQRRAEEFGVPVPEVGIQNGGGIRSDSTYGPGELTQFETFSVLPFGNFVAVVEEVPCTSINALLERGVSTYPQPGGQFIQVAGMHVTFDPSQQAQQVDPTTGEITTPGQRIVSATIVDENGDPVRQVIAGGEVVEGCDPITLATNNFSAAGGDNYPIGQFDSTNLGLTNQQALVNYLTEELGGTVTAEQYSRSAVEGRITAQ